MKRMSKGFAASGLLSLCAIASVVAPGAAYAKAQSQAHSSRAVTHATSVFCEVDGQRFDAVLVGGVTYVNWGALQAMHTPFAYEGNGLFDVTGGTLTGVVYDGVTYLPWNQLAPKVKAEKRPRGGFNFTAVPVEHAYQIYLEANNAPAMSSAAQTGRPAPLLVVLLDGNNAVPNQPVTIQLSGDGTFSDYQNKSDIHVYSSANGYDVYGVNDMDAQTVQATVTWTDPSGNTETATQGIVFSAASATASPSSSVVPAQSSLPSGPTTPPSDTTSASSAGTAGSASGGSSGSGGTTSASPASDPGSSSSSATASSASTSSTASTAFGERVVTSVPITVYQDMILFNVASGGYREMFQLDTGAQEPLINAQMARELGLPHLGSTAVEGVTGQNAAYDSQITLTMGGHTFVDVPCVVDPGYSGTSLLGYNFFVSRGYDLLVSQSQGSLTLLSPQSGVVN